MDFCDVNSIICSYNNNNNKKYKCIVFTKNNKLVINSYETNTETIKLTLYNETNNFYYEYKNLYYDLFDHDTSVTEYNMHGTSSFKNNIITLTGDISKKNISYKQILDSDGICIKKDDKQELKLDINELINNGKWKFNLI